jgi:hypothetical protein
VVLIQGVKPSQKKAATRVESRPQQRKYSITPGKPALEVDVNLEVLIKVGASSHHENQLIFPGCFHFINEYPGVLFQVAVCCLYAKDPEGCIKLSDLPFRVYDQNTARIIIINPQFTFCHFFILSGLID